MKRYNVVGLQYNYSEAPDGRIVLFEDVQAELHFRDSAIANHVSSLKAKDEQIADLQKSLHVITEAYKIALLEVATINQATVRILKGRVIMA